MYAASAVCSSSSSSSEDESSPEEGGRGSGTPSMSASTSPRSFEASSSLPSVP